MKTDEDRTHYYATTAYGWGTGATREAAIRIALQQTGERLNRRRGMLVWSARVGLPQSAHYEIEYYTPRGVPLDEQAQGTYTLQGRARVIKLEMT